MNANNATEKLEEKINKTNRIKRFIGATLIGASLLAGGYEIGHNIAEQKAFEQSVKQNDLYMISEGHKGQRIAKQQDSYDIWSANGKRLTYGGYKWIQKKEYGYACGWITQDPFSHSGSITTYVDYLDKDLKVLNRNPKRW